MGCGQLHAVAIVQVLLPFAALLLLYSDKSKLAVYALRGCSKPAAEHCHHMSRFA